MKSYKGIDYKNVELLDGFWLQSQKLNRDVTIKSVYEQFNATGRFDAFRCEWKEGMPNKPHIFWDSDVAKWIEGAAYIINKQPDRELESIIEDVIDCIERNQGEDGYFNIYFTVCEPENRFQNRLAHELYCCGHLIEAAVVYYEATGRDRFLKLMMKYADYVEKVFKIENSAEFSTPGHEEIELALIRLYECTGIKRYLELAKHFIDTRGQATSKEVIDEMNSIYSQDHIPCREQREAVGHAVRACYLYCAMADIAREYHDRELFEACDALIKNINYKRMYITGGIGSTFNNESFTVDYDLPNSISYAETCAAISLVMFATRMSQCKVSSLYADIAERALYNGVLSGLSLSGDSFFYENALEINLRDREPDRGRQHWPITQRVKVFSCSCCPPNINRFIASIGSLIYTYDEETVYINQFIANSAQLEMGGKRVKIKIQTEYPNDGQIRITACGMAGKRLAVRIPSWCEKYCVDSQYRIEDGYAYVDCGSDDFELSLSLDMTPRWVESNPHVWANAGLVALQKGPVVYCAEGVDNGEELWKIRVDINEPISQRVIVGFDAPALSTKGYCLQDCEDLYIPAGQKTEEKEITLIPYYAFANRGVSEMRVWMIKA
ncbi:MAG: glycoside hydrolase family 127 protein [Clostridiales bacterium]|nr:glycoside hydrolase family 127 protein [Clostridiales bacterium]